MYQFLAEQRIYRISTIEVFPKYESKTILFSLYSEIPDVAKHVIVSVSITITYVTLRSR